jgi:DNA-binding MarR family transcriptional regulator
MTNSRERKTLPQAFRMLSTQAIMLHQAVADMLELNITDYKCMDLIARLGPMTAGKLAEESGLTTGAITGVVDRLEKAGYAKRTDNPKDRRSVIIGLTLGKKKQKEYEEIFLPLERKIEKYASSYTNKELSLFIEFIHKTAEILHEETIRLTKKSKN